MLFAGHLAHRLLGTWLVRLAQLYVAWLGDPRHHRADAGIFNLLDR